MIKRYKRTALSQYLILSLIALAIIGFGFFSNTLMAEIPFVDHFAIPWAAARGWLFEGLNPYEGGFLALAKQGISESSYRASLPEQNNFLRPMINLIFYLPFSLLPYQIARVFWVTFLFICLGLIAYFSLQLSGWKIKLGEKTGILLLSVLWLPGIYAVLTGHLSPIIILLVLISLSLTLQGQDTTAGFFLALTVGSLSLSLFILILLIIWRLSHRQWSLIIALISGSAFLLIIWWLMLPAWPMDWFRAVFQVYFSSGWVHTPLIYLANLLPGIANFLSILLHVLFGFYLMALFITTGRKNEMRFLWKAVTVLVVTYLFQVQADLSYLIMLMPAIYMIFRFWTERWGLAGKILVWAFMFLITGGSWALLFPDIQLNSGLAPVSLLTGLPLIVFIGLIWIRWWALNIPRLPPEYS